MYNSTSTPSTSTDIRINIFVWKFVLSVRIKQVILFEWMNVFTCTNDTNALILQPVLLSVRFDSISTGHRIHVFNWNNDVNIKTCVAISTF